MVCADCGAALRRPRRGPLPRRCARCGKRRRNARARALPAAQAVEYTHWDVASLRQAIAAQRALLDELRAAEERAKRELERLRSRLAWLEHRDTATGVG